MIPPDVNNPFHTHMADDTIHLPAGNVPELHQHVLQNCDDGLAQVRRSHHSCGLLVIGEAGSGKSHLIAQMRHKLATDPHAVLAAIRLGKAYAGRLWRHLRERLVEELLRQYAPATHGANGLLRILRNRFPKFAATAQDAGGGLLQWLIGRTKVDLAPHLNEFAKTCSLDYGLLRVLPQISNPELSQLAHSWLKGEQLGSKDLDRLGLAPVFPSEQEQEAQAQEVVLSLLRLAGESTNLVLCFDEVEALQAGVQDVAVLRQFTTLVTALLAEAGPRLVITCIRPNLLVEVQKAVEVSNVQKMAQVTTRIPPLTWEQAVRVAVARLDAEPTCHAVRQQHPQDAYWPLGEPFLNSTFQQNKRSLTPRHLITACRVEFEHRQKGKREPEHTSGNQSGASTGASGKEGDGPGNSPGGPITTKSDSYDLTRMWEKWRKKHLEKLHAISFDSVLALSLPWLVKLLDAPFVRSQELVPGLGDVNLVFQPTGRGQKPLGVSLCNHPPQMLWRRLDRLNKQWAAAKDSKLGSLVVLRAEFTSTTEKGVARLIALKEAGVRVLVVHSQQLAELAAFQTLMTATMEGDLTRNGKPLEAREYDDWVKDNLSASVKEFFDTLFEPERAKPAAKVAPEVRGKPTAARK